MFPSHGGSRQSFCWVHNKRGVWRSDLLVTFCFSWLEEARPNVRFVLIVIFSGSQMRASWTRIIAGILMMMPMDHGATRGILLFLGIIAPFPVVSTCHVLSHLKYFKCTASPLKQLLNQGLQWCRTLQLIQQKRLPRSNAHSPQHVLSVHPPLSSPPLPFSYLLLSSLTTIIISLIEKKQLCLFYSVYVPKKFLFGRKKNPVNLKLHPSTDITSWFSGSSRTLSKLSSSAKSVGPEIFSKTRKQMEIKLFLSDWKITF